ncbi:excisionase family DNA-binding protein [Enterococcus faecium]|uniref:excisionase family DNA-binding protein n=1 Tax=Enterococcus faecium TaxID=1352 RepID=UPI0038B5C843
MEKIKVQLLTPLFWKLFAIIKFDREELINGATSLVNLSDLKASLAESEIANEVWDTKQAAEYLKTTTRTLTKDAESGKIPAAKVGREWRFSSIALYQYLKGGQHGKV